MKQYIVIGKVPKHLEQMNEQFHLKNKNKRINIRNVVALCVKEIDGVPLYSIRSSGQGDMYIDVLVLSVSE